MAIKPKIVLIYPPLGFVGSFEVNIPVSLLYLSADVCKMGMDVEIIDYRIEKDPQGLLERAIEDNPLLVGISVMSGYPVKKALEITRQIKAKMPNVPIVWGGPHPTVLPEDVLKYKEVDYLVRGWGRKPLALLTRMLKEEDVDPGSIPGLCYRKDGNTKITSINAEFEPSSYTDIPYQLIEGRIDKYYSRMNEKVLPVFTAWGCPYNCNFCIGPIWYKDLKTKWVPFEVGDVVGHIRHLKQRYNPDMIYFFDDTIPSKRHFIDIINRIKQDGIQVKIGVRGMRVNDILKLSGQDLRLLRSAGVETLHVGVESGSQRMLDFMQKGITVEQSLEANRLLAASCDIRPLYNLLTGFPYETIEDLHKTKDFMQTLVKENKNCILIGPSRYIPYPGSALYDEALKNGFMPPGDAEGWARLDQENEFTMPWYSRGYLSYIKMLYMAGLVIDDKERFFGRYRRVLRISYKIAKALYAPFLRFRLRYDLHNFMFEYNIMRFLAQTIARF